MIMLTCLGIPDARHFRDAVLALKYIACGSFSPGTLQAP